VSVDWGSLATVLVVGVVVTLGLVGLFTLGIAGLSRQEAAVARGTSAPAARAGGWACFALAAAAVGYGISLIAG
jgi:hypothetical protein